MSTIFDKIISGEIPSYKVYEDDHCLAFLDIHPCVKGHTLVIPKTSGATVFEQEDEILQSLIIATKKTSQSSSTLFQTSLRGRLKPSLS